MRHENLVWERVFRDVQSQGTLNLKRTRLLSHGIQSVSSFRRHTYCTVAETRDLNFQSKNKHKPVTVSGAIDDSSVFNPLTALLAAPSFVKRTTEVPNLKSLRLPPSSHEHVKGLLPKSTVLKVDLL